MRKSISPTLLLIATAFLPEQFFAQSAGQNPALIMYRFNGGGISPQPVVQGNLLGTVRWDGLTAIGSIRTGASIYSNITDAVSPGILQGNMIFSTSNLGGLTKRMIITEEGFVGIGEMNPLFNLHVAGNTHTTGDFFGRIHMDNNPGNPGPDTYLEEAYFEYKTASALDPGLLQLNNSNGGLLTLAPSNNLGSTNTDHQLFFNDGGIYHREGEAEVGIWAGAWERLLTTGDIEGTAGRVSKFTGPLGSVSNTLGNSQFFDDDIRVGIRNFAPSTDVDMTGATRINGDLGVGTLPVATFRLAVSGNSRLNGAANVTGNLDVDSDANVNGNLDVDNDANVDGGLQVDGNGRVDGRLVVGNPTSVPGTHALYVNGSIIATEVKVELQPNWPDYVFENNYPLMPLSEVEKYVQQEKHLPGIATAKEVAENGLSLGEMQKAQMEKVEEIFLHLIELEKRVNALEAQNKQLQAENAALKVNNGNGAQRH